MAETEGVAANDIWPWVEGPLFWRVVVLGGAALAGLGFLTASLRGNLIADLTRMPGGIALLGGIIAAALVTGVLRLLVEGRRRKAKRPPLRIGKFAVGVGVFKLAGFVAMHIGLLALLASLPVGPSLGHLLSTAGINIVLGAAFASLAAGALRDLLLLVQAGRND
jgi:hypothetical protein